eukprot:TRINITY_DN12363_c0_g1_i3.p1 TRINITY_DN12363_c0_g1~~TRINITY_DN12363_c0_g1_i3.p1  ORF type:complete len:265 (+),score=64.81 TRINITY_DN12363_c0_g1_i3:184-978(+)
MLGGCVCKPLMEVDPDEATAAALDGAEVLTNTPRAVVNNNTFAMMMTPPASNAICSGLGKQVDQDEVLCGENGEADDESACREPGTVPAVVGERYTICKKIGSGSHGTVYRGDDKLTGEALAVKVEFPGQRLVKEYRLYRQMQACGASSRIPEVRWFGPAGSFKVLVMDLLGPCLKKLFKNCGYAFSLKTALLLGRQMVDCLEAVHLSGVVHRDLKPQNFLLGLEEQAEQVYIIDFGLADKFRQGSSGHFPCDVREGRLSIHMV